MGIGEPSGRINKFNTMDVLEKIQNPSKKQGQNECPTLSNGWYAHHLPNFENQCDEYGTRIPKGL